MSNTMIHGQTLYPPRNKVTLSERDDSLPILLVRIVDVDVLDQLQNSRLLASKVLLRYFIASKLTFCGTLASHTAMNSVIWKTFGL